MHFFGFSLDNQSQQEVMHSFILSYFKHIKWLLLMKLLTLVASTIFVWYEIILLALSTRMILDSGFFNDLSNSWKSWSVLLDYFNDFTDNNFVFQPQATEISKPKYYLLKFSLNSSTKTINKIELSTRNFNLNKIVCFVFFYEQ